jgi:hypothetical protein
MPSESLVGKWSYQAFGVLELMLYTQNVTVESPVRLRSEPQTESGVRLEEMLEGGYALRRVVECQNGILGEPGVQIKVYARGRWSGIISRHEMYQDVRTENRVNL